MIKIALRYNFMEAIVKDVEYGLFWFSKAL